MSLGKEGIIQLFAQALGMGDIRLKHTDHCILKKGCIEVRVGMVYKGACPMTYEEIGVPYDP